MDLTYDFSEFSEKIGRGSGTTFRHRKEKVTAVCYSYKEKTVREIVREWEIWHNLFECNNLEKDQKELNRLILATKGIEPMS